MKLKAWIYQGIDGSILGMGGPGYGDVRFFPSEPNRDSQAEKMGYVRAPWLDEPEVKP